MTLSQEALALIRQLEGCHLAAYPDPGSGAEPWTIGYGHTGREVRPDLVIDQQQAEAWLQADGAAAERAVDQLVPPGALNRWQREALVSFCFNVGAGSLKVSTLLRRLEAGEGADRVLSEERPRWVRAEQGPLPALVRRRRLELAHSRRGLDPIGAWQESPSTAAAAPAATGLLQLPVPYLRQGDNRTSVGGGMGMTSSCAMAADYLRPGCLVGSGQAVDRYLALVQRHGTTTDAQAQVQALACLGIRARLRTDGRISDLIRQLQRRMPVPVGWMDKGPVAAPTGGGHWSLVVGWDPQRQQLVMHDPNGEADLINGGYGPTGSGEALRYCSRTWGRRWLVEGDGSGWWLELATAWGQGEGLGDFCGGHG